MSKFKLITDGLVKNNPTFVLLLGMCPTLATTTSAINGLSMGLATLFVLVLSNIVISLIAPVVPDKVHIPVYIVVIATFVTLLQLLMQAFTPAMYETLGLFIPLIVVNCIVLGRAEAFASKNGVGDSALDGIGIGFGFTVSLTVIGLGRVGLILRHIILFVHIRQYHREVKWHYQLFLAATRKHGHARCHRQQQDVQQDGTINRKG